MDDFQPPVVRKRAHVETLDDISTQQREVCRGNICGRTSLLGYVKIGCMPSPSATHGTRYIPLNEHWHIVTG
jgi:hypothetical protein